MYIIILICHKKFVFRNLQKKTKDFWTKWLVHIFRATKGAKGQKKASVEGRSPLQELEVGPHSGPYFLVFLTYNFTNLKNSCILFCYFCIYSLTSFRPKATAELKSLIPFILGGKVRLKCQRLIKCLPQDISSCRKTIVPNKFPGILLVGGNRIPLHWVLYRQPLTKPN